MPFSCCHVTSSASLILFCCFLLGFLVHGITPATLHLIYRFASRYIFSSLLAISIASVTALPLWGSGAWFLNFLQPSRWNLFLFTAFSNSPRHLFTLPEYSFAYTRTHSRAGGKVNTVKPRNTGPKSNGNPPITNAKPWSLQVISLNFL